MLETLALIGGIFAAIVLGLLLVRGLFFVGGMCWLAYMLFYSKQSRDSLAKYRK